MHLNPEPEPSGLVEDDPVGPAEAFAESSADVVGVQAEKCGHTRQSHSSEGHCCTPGSHRTRNVQLRTALTGRSCLGRPDLAFHARLRELALQAENAHASRGAASAGAMHLNPEPEPSARQKGAMHLTPLVHTEHAAFG